MKKVLQCPLWQTALLFTSITGNLLFCAYAGKRACDTSVDLVYERTAKTLIVRIIAAINRNGHLHQADPRKASDALEKYRANWLYSLNYLFPIEITIKGNRISFSAEEVLFNCHDPRRKGEHVRELPWSLLGVRQYDQLPRPLLETTLERQYQQHSDYLDPKHWPGMGLEEWQKLPVPIQKTAAYRMIWEWTHRRSPERHGLSQAEAARILASIGLVESLLDLNKIRNHNEITGNEDRGYMQISDMARIDLHRVAEFRPYKAKDYYQPWVSIQAGSYLFFNRLIDRAGGEVQQAIGMYNAGPHGARRRAQRYRRLVIEKYADTFLQRDEYSPTRFLIARRAQPEYFIGVENDLLFECASRGEKSDDNPSF
jgi:hypothetical protein